VFAFQPDFLAQITATLRETVWTKFANVLKDSMAGTVVKYNVPWDLLGSILQQILTLPTIRQNVQTWGFVTLQLGPAHVVLGSLEVHASECFAQAAAVEMGNVCQCPHTQVKRIPEQELYINTTNYGMQT